MSSNELVSCVIPSYRRCDTVTRAIDSVLAQTYKNIEVCLVDDNVPGDEYSLKLQEALKKYEGDPRVRYITQEKHINGAAARNAGIRAAKGNYIAFLDDDDEWLPEKIEKQLTVMHSDPTIDGVTVLWMRCKNGNVIKKCPAYTGDNFQFKVFAREVSVFSSTVLIKKSAIDHFGGFDETLLRHQDLQFLVDAAAKSKFKVIQDYLVKLHVDSEINRPNLQKFIEAKVAFFQSVDAECKKYSASDQKRIKNAHYFEVVFVTLKERRYAVAIQYIVKIGLNLQAYKDVSKRFAKRKGLA